MPEFEVEMSLGDEVLDGSLDDISKRFERSVLTRLYRTYPSTRKLAKRPAFPIPPSPTSCASMA